MEKYWKIYDKLADNKEIPRELTTAIFGILQDSKRGKRSEEETADEIKSLTNRLKASCNFVESLLKE